MLLHLGWCLSRSCRLRLLRSFELTPGLLQQSFLQRLEWTPLIGDWDGDGIDGIGLYKNGIWMLRNSTSSGKVDVAFVYNPLGQGALPVVGDWDRDGKDTIGVYRDGIWELRNSNSSGRYDIAFFFGPISGGQPVSTP